MEKLIKVLVEKNSDGYFFTTQNIEGVISSTGNTFEEAKNNLEELLEIAKELDEVYNQYTLNFEFKMSVADFFESFPEVKKSELGNRLGIDKSLMSQYTSKNEKVKQNYISDERLLKIQEEIHRLGKELQSVQFYTKEIHQ